MQDQQASGVCCLYRQHTHEWQQVPTSRSIYCLEHAPTRIAAPGDIRLEVSEQEAREKRLFCHRCRRFLVTGEEAPGFADVFAQTLGGDPSLALWARRNSLVVAGGFEYWIRQETVPPDLWVYTRLVLLQDGEDAFSLPVHVTLEVEVRYGLEQEQTAIRHLDSLGCSGDLLLLKACVGATYWKPLHERLAPQGFASHTLRACFAGIRCAQEESETLAHSLKDAYGPFSLEWLFGADRLNAAGRDQRT